MDAAAFSVPATSASFMLSPSRMHPNYASRAVPTPTFITNGIDMQYAFGLKSDATATGTPASIISRAGGGARCMIHLRLSGAPRGYAVVGSKTATDRRSAIRRMPSALICSRWLGGRSPRGRPHAERAEASAHFGAVNRG